MTLSGLSERMGMGGGRGGGGGGRGGGGGNSMSQADHQGVHSTVNIAGR